MYVCIRVKIEFALIDIKKDNQIEIEQLKKKEEKGRQIP